MTITPEQLRSNFPEFSNENDYPLQTLTFWIAVGYARLSGSQQLGATRWGGVSGTPGTLLDLGVELFACHNIRLERDAQRNAQSGGAPGTAKGPVSGESVGSVSQNYDAAVASEEGYGNYNLTTYGTRYANLVKLVGAGPVVIA